MLLDPEFAELLRPELHPGEKLLWAGRPSKWRLAAGRLGRFLAGSFVFVCFSIVFASVLAERWGRFEPIDDLAVGMPLICFTPVIAVSG